MFTQQFLLSYSARLIGMGIIYSCMACCNYVNYKVFENGCTCISIQVYLIDTLYSNYKIPESFVQWSKYLTMNMI